MTDAARDRRRAGQVRRRAERRQARGGDCAAQPHAAAEAAARPRRGDHAEEHHHDRADGRGQNGDCAAAGEADRSPFLKVEASKFTEVGYVGRDVESMIRDLVEIAIDMVREERLEEVEDKAELNAEERLLDLLLPRQRAAEAAGADTDPR